MTFILGTMRKYQHVDMIFLTSAMDVILGLGRLKYSVAIIWDVMVARDMVEEDRSKRININDIFRMGSS
jgi:hypothetical protein